MLSVCNCAIVDRRQTIVPVTISGKNPGHAALSEPADATYVRWSRERQRTQPDPRVRATRVLSRACSMRCTLSVST